MKKIIYTLIGIVAIAILTIATNYLKVGSVLSSSIKSDPRNEGIEASAHYKNYIFPSVLVFDLRKVSGKNSHLDVFRVFLQFASQMKDKKFEKVILAYQGKEKFQLKGDFFQTTGLEFGGQNPVYTIRTFPENVYYLDDAKAFGTWKGGLLSVVGEQMKDFNKFHQMWYMLDIALASK